MNLGKLFILSGPSGSGKTTLADYALASFPISRAITTTTRAPRVSEINGRDYHFISREEFESGIKDERFLEYAQVYGNLYGNSRKEMIERRMNGNNLIAILDINGSLTIKEKILESIHILIKTSSIETLADRLKERATDAPEVINKRISTAAQELSYENRFDYVIINDVLDKAKKELHDIISYELKRK